MFKVLETEQGKYLGAEISGGYTKNDVEEFKKAFEACLEGGDKISVLVKIDELKIADTEFGAFWEDSRYAMQNIDKIGRIAIVGDSKLEGLLVKMDNMIFGDADKGRVEKYFDVSRTAEAWDFIKG